MKGIVFTGDRQCEVREFPVPEPGRGEAYHYICHFG